MRSADEMLCLLLGSAELFQAYTKPGSTHLPVRKDLLLVTALLSTGQMRGHFVRKSASGFFNDDQTAIVLINTTRLVA